jgi:hypothetical protein
VTVSADNKTPRTRQALATWVLLLATAFLVGPTPGDIGGCGGSLANEVLPGDASQQQWDYFEEGICAHMCLRLRSCSVLCASLQQPGPGCVNDSLAAYQQCLRGNIRRDIFGSNVCPHSCGEYTLRYQGASEQDVQVCGHAVLALSCNGIADVIRQPPQQCLAVCGQ